MTPTIKTILLVLAGLWGLVSLIFAVALGRAAGRATPEFSAPEPWQPRLRGSRLVKRRVNADELHAVR